MQAVVVQPPRSAFVAGGNVMLAGGGGMLATVVPVVAQQRAAAPGLSASQQKVMKVLGGVQLAIGASCIVIGIVLVSLHTGTVDDAGSGIWCGAFFVLAGVFALLSGYTNKLGLIITTMVMSIFSSLMMWSLLGFSSAAVDNYSKCSNTFSWSYYKCRSLDYSGFKAADGILLFFALVELIVSIWCGVVCCQGTCRCRCCADCCSVCCCGDAYNHQVNPQVVHYMNAAPAGPGGQQIVIMANPGLYGTGAMNVGMFQQSYPIGGLQPAPAYEQQANGQQAYGLSGPAGTGGNGSAGYFAPGSNGFGQPVDAEKRFLASTSS